METAADLELVYELIGVIRTRPGMFIGAEDIHSLLTFVAGFQTARRHAGRPYLALFADFSRWVCAKYSYDGCGGFQHVLETAFQSRPDLWPSESRRAESLQDGNLRLFFEELDEFLSTRGQSLPPRPDLMGKFFGGNFGEPRE